MPALSAAELDTFLAEPGHLLRVATVDHDGMPRVVPLWFILDHGADGGGAGEIVFTPRSASVLLANVRRDPRLGLSIDEDALPYRKVTVQGEARIRHDVGEDDVWRDLYREVARRYVPGDAAEAYVRGTIDQPRALLAVALDRSRVSTWRMPVEGEDPTGIWARRYYAAGSKLAVRTGDAGATGPM